MKIKTSDLKGRPLDWAVAKAMGWRMIPVPPDYDGENGGTEVLAPQTIKVGEWVFPPRGRIHPGYFLKRWSTDWCQGGPLIERMPWALPTKSPGHLQHLGRFMAHTPGGFQHFGPTPLIASMRAIVAADQGDEVEVPEELADWER